MEGMKKMFEGKKTYTSIAIVAVVAVLKYVGMIDDATAKMLFEFAAALGLYGLYSKKGKST